MTLRRSVPARMLMFRAHSRIALTLLLTLLALIGAPPAAATNVSGPISSDTTWTLAGSPYVMTGNVTVNAGVTLTIEPGVTVQGDAQTRLLTINGSLSAAGNSGAHITFTSTADSASGQWTGMKFGSGAGTSTITYADVRYGGGAGISDANGMVDISGGTVTIEDSTISESSVSGVKIAGGTSGTGASLTMRRTKVEHNGFIGTDTHGDGININNARIVVEDAAFWSNAGRGLNFAALTSSYTPAPSQITGSSIWENDLTGVRIFQSVGAESFGPDGSGNVIYDNGTFGFGLLESWQQLQITRVSLSVDWTGTYWGPVTFMPCSVGNLNGHLSFGVPDPDPNASFPIPRGPVSRTFSVDGGGNWCGNDDLLVNPPASAQPDLYFDPPPPIFGGLLAVDGCLPCAYEDGQIAMSNDAMGGSEPSHTSQPANTATGALAEMATDLKLAGPGIPFAWTRSYNSNDTSAGALGPGWTHPFEANIVVVDQSTGELEYTGGSGQRTRFTKVTGSTGAAKYRGKGFDGAFDRLSDLSYKLVTRDQRAFLFNTSGQLTQIKPRFLPATALTYASGKLSSVSDSAGRTITITYTVADPTLIERVTLPDSRYVEYGYTTGRLTSVRDARGKTWTLAYDGNARLTSIRDPLLRYELQNVLYDGSGRVTSEQNGTGDTMTYAYTTSGGYDVTTVTIPGRGDWVYRHRGNMLMSLTDPLGHATSYSYDGFGRRATVTDGRGNTRRVEYDDRGNVVKEIAPQPLGYTITRTFNATNDLLTEKDGRGNTTTNAYATGSDPPADYQVGQLKTITDRENGITTFKYWTTTSSPVPPATNVGLLKSMTNPRSKVTLYDYDTSGNLTKITSPLLLKTTMTYDSSGRLTGRRDPRGNVPPTPAGYLTKWTYNEVDNVATLTDPGPTDTGGSVTTYAYYDNELLFTVTRTDRDGSPRVTTFAYDDDNRLSTTTQPNAGTPETRLYWPDGKLKSVDSPEHRKTTYDYDAAGRLTTLVEPNGNAPGGIVPDWTWTYGYDNADNRTSETHSDGGTRSIAYDALNRPFQWTDALTHVTSVEYDANSNVTKRTNALTKFKTFTYDKLDRLKTMKDERQLAQPWSYDYYPTGELKCVTTPKLFVTNYGVDDDGRTNSMIDPRAAVACGGTSATFTWTYAYDEAGNRKKVTDPLTNHVDYVFNALNQVTSVADERANVTTLVYDVMNRLWKVTPPAAGGTGTLYTEYTYDPRGNLASRIDPNAHTTSWVSDLDGLVSQKTRPVMGSWNYTYFANGTLDTVETPENSSGTPGDGLITYGYDHMSRPTSVDYSDSTPDVSRTYDLAGRLATMTDGSGTVTSTFDNADRLTDIARTGGGSGLDGTFHYGYDDAGNITARTYPDTTAASAVFDEDGRLTSVASAGVTTSFGYDQADNVTTVTLPSGNGYVATRTFDNAGRLTTVENKKGTNTLSKFIWTLDATTNPTKERTIRTGLADNYNVYQYDARNRVTASCFGVASSATNCNTAANKITYAYDKVTNRTQEVRAGNVGGTGTFNYGYNAADQMTSRGSTLYTYNANGDQASAGTRTFSYDLADRLVSTTSGATTTTYAYDGDDRRVSSTVSGGGADLRLVWDPLAESGIPELALERTPAGALARRYLDGPLGAVSMTNASATFYYHLDPLNTVTDLTNASGAAQWRYTYEGYGAPRTTTNVSGSAPENRLRFNGQYLDAETTLYHLRARQYDPATGRFGALDPIENPIAAPFNGAFVYVNGRPTVGTDPLGLLSLSDIKDAVVGGAKKTWEIKQTVGQYTNPFNIGKTLVWNSAENAYAAYKEGGWLNAANQFNPLYLGLVYGDECAGISTARSYTACVKAAVTIACAASVRGVFRSSRAAAEDAGVVFRSDTSHIFKNATGHLAADTAENRALLQGAVKPENFVGTRGPGGSISVYHELLPDGRQVWVEVRKGTEITNGGVNDVPRP